MTFLISLFFFALVMSILVFVHELGHFIAAKRFGVYCAEFAIGMGPKIFEYKKPHWETKFTIRALPFGGFVSMAGEPGEGDMNVPFERTITGVKHYKRLIIMLAGIFMNLVLAVVVFTGIFATQGIVSAPKPILANVVEGYPAHEAGLKSGDVMTQLEFSDGSKQKVSTFEDLQVAMSVYSGKPIKITVDRDGESLTFDVTPVLNDDKAYIIGVQSPQSELRSVGFFEAIGLGFVRVGDVVSQMVFLITRMFRGVGLENVGGPIAIFGVTAEIPTYGAVYFFNLLAVLSVNLAIVNLIPIPIMDGGRVVITLIEMIIRRPIPEKLENVVMLLGAAFVLTFFVFITFKDILKLLG